MTGDPAARDAPLVSVIMAAHDAEAYIGRALHSLQAQTEGRFEAIVVDDASTDGTAAVVRDLDDDRFTLVRLSRNVGAAEARNVGLRRAVAPLVAILDADDVAWPGRLEAQLAFLGRHPDVDLVGGQIRIVDTTGRVVGRRAYPLGHAAISNRLPRSNPLAHSTVIARTSALLEAGGYDPGCPATHDYALWCELASRGAVFANLPAPLADYRIHPDSIKRRRTRMSLAMTLAVQRKYWPSPPTASARVHRALEQALLLLPGPLLNLLFETLYYRLPGLGRRLSQS